MLFLYFYENCQLLTKALHECLTYKALMIYFCEAILLDLVY